MFTRRVSAAAVASAATGRGSTFTAARSMTEGQRAGAAAGITSGLMTGSPMTALIIGGGTVVAYGVFSHFRHTA